MDKLTFERWLSDAGRDAIVMGVINVTPDSFSDGGDHASAESAYEAACGMIEAGADVLDVGAESTRPGAQRVPASEQIRRLKPVLEKLGRLSDRVVLSLDSTRAEVAEFAAGFGIGLINDVSAGREDPELLPWCARQGLPVALMHMQKEPGTMQLAPSYADVVAEVNAFLAERAGVAMAAGIAGHRVLLDPGIGFGKTFDHNLELLRSIGSTRALGHPVLIGVSRKRFLGEITGKKEPKDRLISSVAAGVYAVMQGADLLRVHDVPETVEALKVIRALRDGD